MMMKKMLILMLVLGLASTAGAALSLDPSGDQLDTPAGAFAVDVVSTDTAMYTWFVAVTSKAYGGISGVSVLTNAGDAGTATYLGDMMGYFDIYQIEALDMSEPFDSVQPGDQFTVNLNFTGTDPLHSLALVLLDPSVTTMDTTTLWGVPEPMTIALLGLGGLFLLRRRK
jgi:hypothetical protein